MRSETSPPTPPLKGEGRKTHAPPSLLGKGAGGLGSSLRLPLAALYLAALSYWTYLLLKPGPVPDRYFDDFSWFDKELLKLILAKCLHLGAYAVFAVFGGLLVPPGRWRTAVLAGLVLHAAASEVGQWVGATYFGTNRHGAVRDVLIDAAGVAIGAYALRRWDAHRGPVTESL